MLGAEMIELAPALVPATLLGAGAWASTRYMVCNPHEMLVRTGLGIQDMDVTKKGMQWPFQDCTKIDMAPQTYEFELHNMSREKVGVTGSGSDLSFRSHRSSSSSRSSSRSGRWTRRSTWTASSATRALFRR